MIGTTNVSLRYGSKKLFEDVNVKFTNGHCYGLIGANGAGKSTFLKILSGEVEPNTGEVVKNSDIRISVLKQDHFAYDEHPVLETVLMGNQKLYAVMKEKDALYAKPDFSEADGVRASDLETLFAELNGWEAEAQAGSMLEGLGIAVELHHKMMKDLEGSEKVKVLLAQALFGQPDVLLLDEPTNHLDIYAIQWLETFLGTFPNTVIVVSHDRYFLNKVCTHIADIDFSKITVFTGNYDFWRQASELNQRLRADQLKKNQDKAEELKAFIARFSANASKSAQASSRQKLLEKLDLSDMPVSTRRSPFVGFESKREAGQDILEVSDLSASFNGEKMFEKVSFTVQKGDKIVLLGKNDLAKTVLMDVIAQTQAPDSGSVKWGVTTKFDYFPTDHSHYFVNSEATTLVDWLREYSEDKDESFIRGFLGRMLFSRDEALKNPRVLSGGEKVRCMLAKMMLSGANILILDGPTNHLDLEAITAVNEGLQRFKGTVLFTSHDHEFIQTTANRVIEIERTIVDDRKMTYEEYVAYRKTQKA